MSDFAQFSAVSGFSDWTLSADKGAQRLFHGRGQCFAGFEYFTVDFFQPILWIVLYRQPDEGFWADFCDALKFRFSACCDAAVVQKRYEKTASTYCLWGEIPANVFAEEGVCRFKLDLNSKQNIGYFMDMQPARQWLAERVEGRRVLNLFSYTCAFSVAAEQAGANKIVNIDTSRPALLQGRENHRLNPAPKMPADISYLSHDILKSWGRLKKLGPFDIVICDPPSRQPGSFDAFKDYRKLVRQFPALLSEGGDVLVCLNAPYVGEEFLRELMSEGCPSAKFISRLKGRADFPEADSDAALKVLHYRL
ncbi:class I SAM-dependent methyltransferase [Zhongshania sp. BJYM1]|uniref:class I SAM-dependent methyltransferase n=1 Tax=Zhongshania aquatica TaxID=2965069 RepID=UPI0022B509E6|nr:class I SAM-dependent methyltransferase [Marortus sp. BJYM1]